MTIIKHPRGGRDYDSEDFAYGAGTKLWYFKSKPSAGPVSPWLQDELNRLSNKEENPVKKPLEVSFIQRSVRELSAVDIDRLIKIDERFGAGKHEIQFIGQLRQIYHNAAETHIEYCNPNSEHGDLDSKTYGLDDIVLIEAT